MTVAGVILATVGVVLFLASLIRTVRANPGLRVPFNRNPPVLPHGTVAMRSIGAGCLASLATTIGCGSVLVVLTGPVVAMILPRIASARDAPSCSTRASRERSSPATRRSHTATRRARRTDEVEPRQEFDFV